MTAPSSRLVYHYCVQDPPEAIRLSGDAGEAAPCVQWGRLLPPHIRSMSPQPAKDINWSHVRRIRGHLGHFKGLSVLIVSGSPIIGAFEFRTRVDPGTHRRSLSG